MSFSFHPLNTDLAIVFFFFFFLQELKLVIMYCHDVMMTTITYLLAVQGAPPACLCVHEECDPDGRGGRGCDEDGCIGSDCVNATMVFVFFFWLFFCP